MEEIQVADSFLIDLNAANWVEWNPRNSTKQQTDVNRVIWLKDATQDVWMDLV